MAKLVIFAALCAFSALAAARPGPLPQFTIQGRTFCDTCLVGFETPASTYIQGAVVRLECKDKDSLKLVYSKEGVTDETGCYKIPVAGDHADQICESVLVSSPDPECGTIEQGRERARVYPTNDNGIASNVRYANNLGFVKNYPLATCSQVLLQYQEFDD